MRKSSLIHWKVSSTKTRFQMWRASFKWTQQSTKKKEFKTLVILLTVLTIKIPSLKTKTTQIITNIESWSTLILLLFLVLFYCFQLLLKEIFIPTNLPAVTGISGHSVLLILLNDMGRRFEFKLRLGGNVLIVYGLQVHNNRMGTGR